MIAPPVPTYATAAELAAFLGLFGADGVAGDPTQLPAGATKALRSAIKAVREETLTWFFPADPLTGLPLSDGLAGVMRTATCEQAEALLELEVDLAAGGTLDATVESSVAAQSVRVTVAGADQAAASRNATIVGLCPEARRTLRLSGMSTHPWVVG